jgi:hypothetical protein
LAPRIKSPISKTFCFPECIYINVLARISLILRICRPSTILRGISKIIVYAINLKIFSVTTAFCPLNEVRRVKPIVAYTYASATIVRIASVVLIVASLNHSIPCSVDSISASYAVHSVLSGPFNEIGVLQASTGARISAEFGNPNITLDSTRASASNECGVVHASLCLDNLGERIGSHSPVSQHGTDGDCFHVLIVAQKDADGNRSAVTLDATG